MLGGKDFAVDADPHRIVDYFDAHYGAGLTACFAVALSTVAFAFFAGALREAVLAAGARVRKLVAIAGIGATLYLGGLLLMVVVHFGLIDAAHHHQVAVVQTLNYLDQDDFLPTIAGLAVFMLAGGAAIIRARTLPAWLGWLAVVIGVVALAGPLGAVAFLIAPVWTLIVGIVLVLARPAASGRPVAPTVPSLQMR